MRRRKVADTANAKAMETLRAEAKNHGVAIGRIPYPLVQRQHVQKLLRNWIEGGHRPSAIKLYQVPTNKKAGIWYLHCPSCNFRVYLSAIVDIFHIPVVPGTTPIMHIQHALYDSGWHWDNYFLWTLNWSCPSIKKKGVHANDPLMAPTAL